MLRIAVCDDDSLFLLKIFSILHSWQYQETSFHVETFENGESLLQAHAELPFDILFLDVLMPLFNGIEVAKEIRSRDKLVKIVFLTSTTEYAVDSYTVKASNYLLKPLDQTKLFSCLDEICEEIRQERKSLYIKCVNSIHKVILSDIEYIEAQNKHTIFTLYTGQTLISTDPLYLHECTLSQADGFFKCHRGYIVNLNHIDTYTKKEIRMRSGFRIPISRNYQSDFKNSYFSYIFRKAGENL